MKLKPGRLRCCQMSLLASQFYRSPISKVATFVPTLGDADGSTSKRKVSKWRPLKYHLTPTIFKTTVPMCVMINRSVENLFPNISDHLWSEQAMAKIVQTTINKVKPVNLAKMYQTPLRLFSILFFVRNVMFKSYIIVIKSGWCFWDQKNEKASKHVQSTNRSKKNLNFLITKQLKIMCRT